MADFMKGFFIIDSNCLESVKDHLYGFKVTDDGIYSAENIPSTARNVPGEVGCYVDVSVADDEIRITQDNIGCYSLYLFREGDYFALGNSFPRLVEHLQFHHKLTFNWEYSEILLSFAGSTHLMSATPIREISVIGRDTVITIDRARRKLDMKTVATGEDSVALDSREGMERLDRWFEKWTRVMRNISHQTENVSIDLSGGFDSRMTFVLMANAGVDWRRINVNSYTDGLHVHSRDYEIASEIAKEFGFELNAHKLDHTGTQYSPEERFALSYYAKGGFHAEFYAPPGLYRHTTYSFGGIGGELIRNTHDRDEQGWKGLLFPLLQDRSRDACKRVFEESVAQVKAKYAGIPMESRDLPRKCYAEARNRNHFGRVCVEKWLGNVVGLSPFFDPQILSLKLTTADCDDRFLLMAIIFRRYCPKLLEFPFTSGRFIKPETIRKADEIIAKYPFVRHGDNGRPFLLPPDRNAGNDEIHDVTPAELDKLMASRFRSASFQAEARAMFGERLLESTEQMANGKGWYPLRIYFLMFPLMRAKHAADASISRAEDPIEWIDGLTAENVARRREDYFPPQISKNAVDRLVMKIYRWAKHRLMRRELV